MLKRSLAIVLSGILLLMAFGFRPLYAQVGADSQAAAKARAEVARLGAGTKTRR